MHDDDGLGQRPERADRHRPVVRVRTEDVVGVAVASVDHLVEDRAVEGEDRAHASFASWVLGDPGDGPERDGEPGGAVARFVDRLVDGLVGDVRPQDQVLLGGQPAVGGASAVLDVPAQEGVGVAVGPLRGAERDLVGLRAVGLDVGLHGVRRVVEGPEHAGDVAPHQVGTDPLGERLGRLALEVHDLPALDGAQRLPEVEVAVHALGGGGLPGRAEGRDAGEGTSRARRRARRAPGRSPAPPRGGSASRRRARSGRRRPTSRWGTARPARRGPARWPDRAGRPRPRSRRRPRRRAGRPRRTGRARWPARGPSRRSRSAGTAGASRAGPGRRRGRRRGRSARASRRGRRRGRCPAR